MNQKDNYLTETTLRLFKRLEYYKGYLFHLENDVRKYTKILVESLNKHNIRFLKGSRLVISDFTGESDNGWEINFPLPTPGYVVTTDNYQQQITQLIQVISSSLIVQSYEALETFLKEILVSYFENNNQIAYETIGKANCIWNRNKVDWINTVQKLDKGVNNKGLLKIIRILNPEFKKAESNNLKNVNLADWFNVISIVRHAIVHSEAILKNNEFNKLNKKEKEIIENMFDLQNLYRGRKQVLISGKDAQECIEFMCEYAFQVFKYLSLSKDLEWRILKNMKNEA